MLIELLWKSECHMTSTYQGGEWDFFLFFFLNWGESLRRARHFGNTPHSAPRQFKRGGNRSKYQWSKRIPGVPNKQLSWVLFCPGKTLQNSLTWRWGETCRCNRRPSAVHIPGQNWGRHPATRAHFCFTLSKRWKNENKLDKLKNFTQKKKWRNFFQIKFQK